MERLGGERVSEKTEKLPENVVIVDIPEARFRLLYEFHNHVLEHSPREIRGVDALAFEAATTFSDDTPRSLGLDPNVRPSWAPPGSDNQFASALVESCVPLYFVDIVPGKDFADLRTRIDTNLRSAEIGAGTLASLYVALKGGSSLLERRMSRRDFLKVLGGAAIAGKGFLASYDGGMKDKNRNLSEYERDIVALSEKFNPELEAITLTLRNALWVYKLRTLVSFAQYKRLGNKRPEIALVLGAAHTGFEDMAKKNPDELLEKISSIMQWLKQVAEILHIPKPHLDITAVARYEFDTDKNGWKIADIQQSSKLVEIQTAYES